METGKDYANGGAEFNVGNGINIIGQADIINSCADIKYLIYDEKKLTMDELCKALDANFEGYDEVYKMCMEAPKYGNDDPKADFCAGEIYNYLVDQIESYDSAFGKLTAGNLPHSRFTQGTQMNLKIDPKLLEGERGLNNMMTLLKTQCTLDVYHTQYNIIDPEVLIDAQKHPENYKDLLVRVAGYTAFFVELGKDIQDDIIQRTEIENWG